MFQVQPVPTPTPVTTTATSPTPTVEIAPAASPPGIPSPFPVEIVDSTPLLTTLVQSGAALVAIVAGLLIARLVALVGERNSLERRVRELAEVVEARRAEYEEAHQERFDDDADDFIEHVLDRYFSEDEPTFEKFYDSYDDEPGDGEELRPYYEDFDSQVKEVARKIDPFDLLSDERTGWLDDDERDQVLEGFADGRKKRIAEALLDLVEAEWKNRRRRAREQLRKKSFGAFSPIVDLSIPPQFLRNIDTNPVITMAGHQISSARYLQMRANEANAKSAMENAERDLAHAEYALANVSRPEGLVVTVVLLAVMAFTGMVLPLIPLTAGRVALSTAGRWVYTGFFLASLAAFFVYLAVEISRLNKPTAGQRDVP